MAGRDRGRATGRGRGKTGTTRHEAGVEVKLEDFVPDSRGVPEVAHSQIPTLKTKSRSTKCPEEVKAAEKQCPVEVIIIEDTTSGSTGVPEVAPSRMPTFRRRRRRSTKCTEEAKAAEKQWPEEVIIIEDTTSGSTEVPVISRVSRKETQHGKRKPLQALNSNGATSSAPSPSSGTADKTCVDKVSEIAVQRICDAIDEEVANRSNLIRAIAATQLSSITSQLKLKLCSLPVHVQSTPLSEYLESCPNIESKVLDDGRIQLKKASPCAVLLRNSKKNLSEILNRVRDNPGDEPSSLFITPAFNSTKIFVNKFPQSANGEDLSRAEYLAKQQALGHINGYAGSSQTQLQEDSAMSLKSGLWRGKTPKTMRIPGEREMVLSVNGSPLVNPFTPGPYFAERKHYKGPTQ